MTLKECLVDRFEYDGSINHVSARLAICLIEPAPYPVQEHRVRHIGTIKLLYITEEQVLELVSKELNHFGVIADLLRQIGVYTLDSGINVPP